MKVSVLKKVDVDIKTLHVEAGVRYWEDSTVNGDQDSEEGELIPCKDGDLWKPIIELETGKILNWEQGKVADIHYKVCDAGCYYLKDSECETVLSIEDDYVPSILCPEENGYGDYIIMKVDENGQIANWKVDISDFEKAE
jgi:hypothetical protein